MKEYSEKYDIRSSDLVEDVIYNKYPVLINGIAEKGTTIQDAELLNKFASKFAKRKVRVAERDWLVDVEHTERILQKLEELGINIYRGDGRSMDEKFHFLNGIQVLSEKALPFTIQAWVDDPGEQDRLWDASGTKRLEEGGIYEAKEGLRNAEGLWLKVGLHDAKELYLFRPKAFRLLAYYRNGKRNVVARKKKWEGYHI